MKGVINDGWDSLTRKVLQCSDLTLEPFDAIPISQALKDPFTWILSLAVANYEYVSLPALAGSSDNLPPVPVSLRHTIYCMRDCETSANPTAIRLSAIRR